MMSSGWEVKNFDEVCELIGGSQPPKEEFIYEPKKGYIRLIQVRDYKTDKYATYIPKESAKRFCNADDIMIGRYGPPIFGIFKGIEGAYNVALMKAVINKEICYPDYFFRFLQTENIKKFVEKSSKRAAGQDGVRKELLATYPVPLPSIDEQKRIVEILDEAFAAIDKAKANVEKNLQNAKELFESYLQNIFTDKADKYEKKSLQEVTNLITKGSSPKWQGIKYVENPGVLFITSENVGENILLLNERKYVEEKFNEKDSKSILRNGDVLTNIVGASIGRTAIFNLDDIANVNQAVCVIRCNRKLLFNEYLMYLLNSPFTKQHLHDNEVNNARANLSLGFFRSLEIPIPLLAIQKEIVSKIKAIHIQTQKMEKIYQQKLNDLEELKKSILQKAFTGELTTKAALEI